MIVGPGGRHAGNKGVEGLDNVPGVCKKCVAALGDCDPSACPGKDLKTYRCF